LFFFCVLALALACFCAACLFVAFGDLSPISMEHRCRRRNCETSLSNSLTLRDGQRKQQSQKRSEEAEEGKAEALAHAQGDLRFPILALLPKRGFGNAPCWRNRGSPSLSRVVRVVSQHFVFGGGMAVMKWMRSRFMNLIPAAHARESCPPAHGVATASVRDQRSSAGRAVSL
jgi:hypothetical protein